MVGRLGGDEFAILLPEANIESAQAAMKRIKENMSLTMQANQWPITFSIGAQTFTKSNYSVDEVVKITDNLMYTVKNQGKNDMVFAED